MITEDCYLCGQRFRLFFFPFQLSKAWEVQSRDRWGLFVSEEPFFK